MQEIKKAEDVLEELFGYQKSELENLNLISTGLINKTFSFECGNKKLVLQKLNSIFEPVINQDIKFVTGFLKSQDILTLEILDFKIFKNQVWRILSFIDGDNFSKPSQNIIFEAAKFVCLWHKSLNSKKFEDLNYKFKNTRENKHDLEEKIIYLEEIFDIKKNKLDFDFNKIKKSVFELIGLENYKKIKKLDKINGHGDLKLNNIIFSKKGLTLIDLDTLGKKYWPFEMGDALRSWCNPVGEDSVDTKFDLELFESSISGYKSGGFSNLDKSNFDFLILGLKIICLDLALRFLIDSIEEKYFSFDPSKFESLGEANLIRGLGQWNLFQDICAKEGSLENILRK